MEQQEQENTICFRCDGPILQAHHQTGLLCGHKMHTTCFLEIAHLPETICRTCNEPINPNMPVFHNHNDNQSDIEATRIQNLYDTNATFKGIAQKLAKKRRLVSTKHTAYLKLIKTKKQEIREQLLLLKAQLEGLTETKKTEIRESTVYKEYIAANRGYSLLIGKLRNDYNCSERKIGRALRNKVGFRRFTPLHYRRYYRNPLD